MRSLSNELTINETIGRKILVMFVLSPTRNMNWSRSIILKPSLKDYIDFHGMLCNPKAAIRCIRSFEDGTALFANQEEYGTAIAGNSNLSNFDLNAMPIGLNLLTYYLLVLLSLTGLCSILRQTKIIKAIEYKPSTDNKDNQSEVIQRFKSGDNKFIESSKASGETPLRLPPEAIDYVINRSFELGPLSRIEAIKNDPNTKEEINRSGVEQKMAMPELDLIRR